MPDAPAFTVGIEEEYLLVDPETRALASNPPAALFDSCTARIGQAVSPEFLRCQIEVGTPVCATLVEARAALADLRRGVREAAAEHGLAVIAASTHPFSSWKPQVTTDKDRYQRLAVDIGMPAHRLLTCAMHVHAGIEDADLRIDLMGQAAYFLPHLAALTTSSPFWEGRPTGLRSYRLAVFDEMPRTGLPDEFDSFADFQRHVAVLTDTGVIEDATKIWWDIRPSDKFPTLEARITDIATRLDDGMAAAALYLCVLRMLWRLRRDNMRWRRYKRMLVAENRWRAMRYGVDAGLIDFGRGEILPYATLLDELLDLVADDADALGCSAMLARARRIAAEGASAHRQMAVYEAAVADAPDDPDRQDAALRAVVDHLIAETGDGL